MRRHRILTWHVHGSYLWYLSRSRHLFYVPVKPGRPEGYGGLPPDKPWPANLVEVPAGHVADLDLDCVLYQSHRNWELDRLELLTPAQRALPRVYLEHDPPRHNPTDTRHPVDDPGALLVHVTPFNDLMWDPGRTPTTVIEHGVDISAGITYTGEIARGLVIINGLASRGRRLGLDVFERVRAEVPLDLVGLGSEALGGLGEIPLAELPAVAARYRFLFNPIRYTSLGLAVCEAMSAGVPIVALATTEYATVVRNGVSGYADTDVNTLIGHMHRLLDHPDEARRLSAGAREAARRRFGIERFAREWDEVLEGAVSGAVLSAPRATPAVPVVGDRAAPPAAVAGGRATATAAVPGGQATPPPRQESVPTRRGRGAGRGSR